MPANAPFLAKFAEPVPKKTDQPKTSAAVAEKGTLVTKVNRETTDDR